MNNIERYALGVTKIKISDDTAFVFCPDVEKGGDEIEQVEFIFKDTIQKIGKTDAKVLAKYFKHLVFKN